MFVLNDLLTREGLDPTETAVMLHTPKEARFARVLPWIARVRPDLLEAYQSTHAGPASATLRRRRQVVVFVGLGDGTLALAGVWRVMGERSRPWAEILAEPGIATLREEYGIGTLYDLASAGRAWFDLQRTEHLAPVVGRLRIAPRLTRAYVRRAETFPGDILSIERESLLDAAAPDWRRMILTAPELRVLPESWAVRLREWRGIYLIVDEVDGARYVGAAWGEENLLGRWRAHVAGTTGVTVELARRATAGLRFSILERVSPDMPAEEVIALEQSWMDRLHSRRFGLNT